MTQNFLVERATPDRVPDLLEMLDSVYRPQLIPGSGMIKEFPHLFHSDNAENLYYVADAGRPVSMVCVYPQEVVFQGISMKVASVGCVVTLPEYQGRQISSQILHQAIADLTDAEIPLLLVSGDRGLYRRADCVPVGRMYDIRIPLDKANSVRGQSSPNGEFEVRELSVDEYTVRAPELARIYQSEACRYRRTDEHMARLLNALWTYRPGHTQRAFTVTLHDELVAYVVAYASSRNASVVEVLEWAGSRNAVLASFAAILDRFGAAELHFHGHIDDQDVLAGLRSIGVNASLMTLQGTVRPLDIVTLIADLQPILQERFGGVAQLSATDKGWRITLPSISKEFDKIGQIAQWLFNHDASSLGLPFVLTDDLNYI